MHPTTPMGSRTTRLLPTSSSKANDSATWAALVKLLIGRPTCTSWESIFGMPVSRLITVAISSMRAPSASPTRVSSLARSSTGVAAQPSKASRAAVTAASTSAAVPAGMVAITSSVMESITSSVPVPVEGTQRPPM